MAEQVIDLSKRRREMEGCSRWFFDGKDGFVRLTIDPGPDVDFELHYRLTPDDAERTGRRLLDEARKARRHG